MVVESWEKVEGRGLRNECRAELTCFVVVILLLAVDDALF